MIRIETTVKRECEYDGHAYAEGDLLAVPLLDALRLAKGGVVRLGYRRQPVPVSEPVTRKRTRKPRASKA